MGASGGRCEHTSAVHLVKDVPWGLHWGHVFVYVYVIRGKMLLPSFFISLSLLTNSIPGQNVAPI